jgi:hypothetical protein
MFLCVLIFDPSKSYDCLKSVILSMVNDECAGKV